MSALRAIRKPSRRQRDVATLIATVVLIGVDFALFEALDRLLR